MDLNLAYCAVSCRQCFVVLVFWVNTSIGWPSTVFLGNGTNPDLAYSISGPQSILRGMS